MELRQLQTFLAVYEAGGFRAAAEREHLTQSAVSRQIQQLERALDVSLFLRSPRAISPTPAGESLYARVAPHVRATIEALRAARTAPAAENVAVGFIAPALLGPLPQMIGAARATLPHVTLALAEHDSSGVAAGLAAGQLALGFLAAAQAPPRLRSRAVMQIRYGIAVRAADPLAGRSSIELRELAGRTIISLAARERIHHRILETIHAHCPDVTVQAAFGFGTVQSLVHGGVGVAVVPLGGVIPVPPGMTLIETRPSLPGTTLWVAARRGQIQPVVRQVFDLVKPHSHATHPAAAAATG